MQQDAKWKHAKELVVGGMEPEAAMVAAGLRRPEASTDLLKPATTRELCVRSERLAVALAPIDLEGVPVYVVAQSELSTAFASLPSCFGFTRFDLDLLLESELGRRWQGRGAAMVIADVSMRVGQVAIDSPLFTRRFMSTVEEPIRCQEPFQRKRFLTRMALPVCW